MAEHTNPSRETRAEEGAQARHDHSADRGPTADEETAAETNTASDTTAREYKEMTERGAKQEGEGRLP